MNCLVTAGPAYEPLDSVRRMTNHSTGRLGCSLASFLTKNGHAVTLLLAADAAYSGERQAARIIPFSTVGVLREKLIELIQEPVSAIFHAAAVSDFSFGRVFSRSPEGKLTEVKASKISTRLGPLMAELQPTPKILTELRHWFPKARIAGWKYEVDGPREGVLSLARKQMLECLTDACVANGPGYGKGYGFVAGDEEPIHCPDDEYLFTLLQSFAGNQ
jgi:phosphopantothenoylcysteine synthetase/decarboxylase